MISTKVVADEVLVVVGQHIGVDVAGGARRAVPITLGEGVQNPVLEVRARDGRGRCRARRSHTRCGEGDFGFEELR
jgi:hypothetical protein